MYEVDSEDEIDYINDDMLGSEKSDMLFDFPRWGRKCCQDFKVSRRSALRVRVEL